MGWKRQDKEIDPGAKVRPGHPFYDLIKEAYRVFAGPTPQDVDVCTECCMPKAIAADFFRPHIAVLPHAYLTEWFGAACPTEGVRQDIWSYLLPRTLEVLAAGEEPNYVGVEISLSRFDTGNPARWSHEQWNLLDRFQRQFLHTVTSRYHSLDDTLCLFSLGGWQLSDLLAQVLAMPDEEIVGRLWRDWCDGYDANGTIWTSAFWKKDDEARVSDFYKSDALRDRIEAIALSDSVQTALAKKASDIFSVIERGA